MFNDDLSIQIALRDAAYWEYIFACWAQSAIKDSKDVGLFYRLDAERCAAQRTLLHRNFEIDQLLAERRN